MMRRGYCPTGVQLRDFGEDSGMVTAFGVRNGVIVTPAFGSALSDCLTRGGVLEAARPLNLDVVDRPIARRELACADKV